MKLKDCVSIIGARWEIFHALILAEEVFERYGSPLFVTSMCDGEHSENSLHYQGLAADLRIWYIDEGSLGSVVEDLKLTLGYDYDVVLEDTHIHIEFDPK